MNGKNASRPDADRTGQGRRARRLAVGAVTLGLTLAGCGVPASGAGFPTPPQRSPVQTVLVSASGRVLTAVGGQECGHNPRLVARSHPRSVSLVFAYPRMSCHAESMRSVTVRATLPEPLGSRALVHPDGSRIPYFGQRQFARVTALPVGYRLASEIPAGQPTGDKRTYAIPPGASQSCPCAELVIWQQVIGRNFMPPTRTTSQHSARTAIHGIPAAVLTRGPFFARSVNWAESGYYLTVGVAYNAHAADLSIAQLIAVANGLKVTAGTGTSGSG